MKVLKILVLLIVLLSSNSYGETAINKDSKYYGEQISITLVCHPSDEFYEFWFDKDFKVKYHMIVNEGRSFSTLSNNVYHVVVLNMKNKSCMLDIINDIIDFKPDSI